MVVDVLILGYIGANPPEGLYLFVGRVATIYYFVHFILIMPILGFKEKTIPRPLYWTGFRVEPLLIEFWQNMPFRLHDRVEYKKNNDSWLIKRLYP